MRELLEHIEIEPAIPATATVIWLHGLGADGHDFEPIVPELHLPKDAAIRFIFPPRPHSLGINQQWRRDARLV